MAMDRQTWADFGPLEANGGPRLFLESSDTILSMKAAADGRLRFCPDARIRHMNRTTLGVVLSHQIGLGRSAAILARRSATLPHRDLVARAWAAPMVAGARWLSLWRRLLSWRIGLSPRAFSLSPELLLALGAWGYGLFRANWEFAAAER
jgi:GT2 family glycosyltransferase